MNARQDKLLTEYRIANAVHMARCRLRDNAPLTEDDRRELCAVPVTLDGEPASISGIKMPFALVRYMDRAIGCEFSWSAVARIVAAGGRFKSL